MSFLLLAGSLVWCRVAVPCRLVAVDVPFWKAAIIRDEMISMSLPALATVGGLLAWRWSLHKTRGRWRDMPNERGLT